MSILSTLKMVAVDQVCLHEAHEAVRLEDTGRAIREDGFLRNPPLAVRMSDGRYLIVDGAHRTCALQSIGCRRIPVQVVDGKGLTIESWGHVVEKGLWYERLLSHPDLALEGEVALAEVTNAQGETTRLYCSANASPLEAWHRIVSAYSRDQAVRRVASGTPLSLRENQVLLTYPSCSLHELEKIVCEGQVVPAGVTRFTVQGRILNLRIPLRLMTERTMNAGEWEELLMQWSPSMRLYSEPVYFCEV